ncbi:MAG: cytochrome c peroxidase [Phycisphaerales bacterium]
MGAMTHFRAGLSSSMNLKGAVLAAAVFQTAGAALPPVPVPPENPITESKRVLGKILFFEEQISTSMVVSCATCHVASTAGADPRVAVFPGLDGVFNTPDDVQASPGVVKADSFNSFQLDTLFALRAQVTNRAANPNINAGYAPDLFWDGRARTTFIDPETSQIAIATGGALESQCVNPPLSSVEMAHAGMNWAGIEKRLQRVRALDLSTNIPADVQSVLNTTRSYRELFRLAFGDEAITARRIAFALGTYQRTLISDQTPWDRFQAGETTALTPNQQQGLQAFLSVGPQGTNCTACHVPPLFTDNTFRNLGLRPIAQDNGRQAVTGNPGDRGRFKVPGLRNAGLKSTFMHTGQFPNLGAVMAFYGGVRNVNPNPDNRDPALNGVNLPPQVGGQVADFIANGLLDPRVRDQTFPFDRPALFQSPGRAANQTSVVNGTGVAGITGVPRIVVQSAPMVGNRDFKIGLDNARSGATARLGISTVAPQNGRITPQSFFSEVTVGNTTSTFGVATQFWPLVAGRVSGGQVLFAQWFVDDAAAVGGQALSSVVRIPIFCGSAGCPSTCSMSDLNGDGFVDDHDFVIFAGAYDAFEVPLADVVADLNADAVVDDGDFAIFSVAYDALMCN